MATIVPAGELEVCDDYDDYEFEDEPFLESLSSFHGDVPLVEEVNTKQNCFVDDKMNKSSVFLLSDLQNAVISGNIKTVKALVKNRPDYCNSVLDSGWTPLAYASNFGHVLVVEALLEAGANVDLQGKDGSIAMMTACKCPRNQDTLTVLKKLIDKKANTRIVDKNGKTVLIYAVRSGKYEVVELILKHSLDIINEKDKKGWTALDWAISKAFEHIVLLLIENGATVYDSKSECISSLSSNVIESLKGLSSKMEQSAGEGCQTDSLEKEHNQESLTLQPFNIMQPHQSNLEEDVVTINSAIVGESYQKYGQLELLLCGLDLTHLIAKFHEHDFRFEQLLCASNDDLIALGIKKVGVRNRILTAVKDWHTSDWQENSLPNFSSIALTFGNLQALLRTSSDHLLYVSSALRYAKNQLKTYPQVMTPAANMHLEKNPDEIVIAQVEDILRTTHKLCKSLKSLHVVVNGIKEKNSDQFHQADMIKRQKRPYCRKGKIIAISLPLLAALAFFVTRYRVSR